MDRASAGVMVIPLRRTILLIASSQPSGVVRSQEMRERLPFASLVWQVPQREITSGSVTGIPSSTGPSAATTDPSPPALPLWAKAVDSRQEADTRRVKIRVVTCSSAYQSPACNKTRTLPVFAALQICRWFAAEGAYPLVHRRLRRLQGSCHERGPFTLQRSR